MSNIYTSYQNIAWEFSLDSLLNISSAVVSVVKRSRLWLVTAHYTIQTHFKCSRGHKQRRLKLFFSKTLKRLDKHGMLINTHNTSIWNLIFNFFYDQQIILLFSWVKKSISNNKYFKFRAFSKTIWHLLFFQYDIDYKFNTIWSNKRHKWNAA